MKRSQHKDEIRRKVLKVSKTLFLKKGYRQTTIKEITRSAGITIGSLYHFFNGKQDILLHLTREVFDSATVFADLMLKKESEPWLRFAFEIGIQLYLVQQFEAIAELYLAAHESPEIVQTIVRSAADRNQGLFQGCCPGFTQEKFYAAAVAVKGIFHSFIQDSIYNKQNTSLTFVLRAVEIMLAIYNIPEDQIEKSIQSTLTLIEKIPLTLFDFK